MPARDEEIDLADAALLLGALDMPNVSLARYRDHLERLGEDVAGLARAGEPLERRRLHLNAVLFDTHGYAGDAESYDAPENANLLQVIDRRVGLPVSLGILYIHAGRAQGWAVDGLAFPRSFPGADGRRRPPRDRRPPSTGARCWKPATCAACSSSFRVPTPSWSPATTRRSATGRSCSGFRTTSSRARSRPATARVPPPFLERMLLIAPDAGGLWHELGMVRARLGTIKDAVEALERSLACPLPEAARTRVEAALASLTTSLH